MRVSLLKFEPKVSNFPALEAKLASSAHTTMGSLFSVLGNDMNAYKKKNSLFYIKKYFFHLFSPQNNH